MKFVDEIYINNYEVKQSKFITYLTPYSQFKKTLVDLKELHPKARHFVVAYRYLNEFDQIIEYSSDDGEPKGTSGKPTLMVLQGSLLINTSVIVVRYFGGTKLGTGGLVRAYSEAVNLVIATANLIEYKKKVIQTISFSYTNGRKIEYECLIYGIEIVNKTFQGEIRYDLEAPQEDMKCFLEKVQRLLY
ncbi:MAG: YigZ family protein [Campylobacterota bacterium]|nr:YigZ family protein [Campylobacterota bacterium]